MIILAIDIGNTRTTLGLFKGKKLTGTMHFPSASLSTKEFVWKTLNRLFRQLRVSPSVLSGVVISSVVPTSTKMISTVTKQKLHLHPLIVSGRLNTGIRIQYKAPAALGADRICSAVAANTKYGGPVIIIDAGTATTYSVVSKNGTFLGGAITPGMITAAFALHQGTAQLPNIPLRFPRNVIGESTMENIQSGILYGTVDAMEGLVRRIKKLTGKRTKVILTGGFSHLLKTKARFVDKVEPTLVLEGARLIFERARTTPK